MNEAQIEAPTLPGEVWRGLLAEDDDKILVCVADGRPKFYYPGRWAPGWRDPAPDFGYRILATWALASVARAKAEEAFRRAEKALSGVPSWTDQGLARRLARIAAFEKAKAELLALGGVP